MIVVFPWPPRELSPNSRPHYMARARATRTYRTACYWEAFAAGIKPNEEIYAEAPIGIHLEFVPPTRRTYDVGNCVAWVKAGLDGLADAMGIDDKWFRLSQNVCDKRIGGMVIVTIQPPESQ